MAMVTTTAATTELFERATRDLCLRPVSINALVTCFCPPKFSGRQSSGRARVRALGTNGIGGRPAQTESERRPHAREQREMRGRGASVSRRASGTACVSVGDARSRPCLGAFVRGAGLPTLM